ncbi:hypothetical protein CTI12_AA008010 [Artemisia annua]|uniref:Uncharacterized protein n=1 Tax=Artemisia annua TaxID=35608 RepID=A0A2U1Q0N2_ARTAN|nr:hypothetical protein CTI12_AA008010 [Artemisia annua]
MAPLNGRTVLVFRALCGCPPARLEVWGAKRGCPAGRLQVLGAKRICRTKKLVNF